MLLKEGWGEPHPSELLKQGKLFFIVLKKTELVRSTYLNGFPVPLCFIK